MGQHLGSSTAGEHNTCCLPSIAYTCILFVQVRLSAPAFARWMAVLLGPLQQQGAAGGGADGGPWA